MYLISTEREIIDMASKPLIYTAIVAAGLTAGFIGSKFASAYSNSETSTSMSSSVETTKKSVASSAVSEKKSVASSTVTTPWSDDKRQQLSKFMSNWQTEMGQSYEEYYPGHDFDLYGLMFPSSLTNSGETLRPTIDNQFIDMQWSNDGTGNHDYNLVAVYGGDASSDKNSPLLTMYLFTLHNGQPEVLVTQQNQGNPEGRLYMKPTDNQALQAGFESIINNN